MPRLFSLRCFTASAMLLASCSHGPTDEAIATQIKAKYFSDPLLKSAAIAVAVKNGLVTISGTVSGADVELQAYKLALSTDGVRYLNDAITIAPNAASNQQDPFPSLYSLPPPKEAQASATAKLPYREPLPPPDDPPVEVVREYVSSPADTPTQPQVQEAALSDASASTAVNTDSNVNAFADTPTNSNAPTHSEPVRLTAAGAISPAHLYQDWFKRYQSIGNVELNYQPIGSSGGIRDLIEGNVDFAATDVILSKEQIAAFKATHRGHTLLALPTAVAAVVPSYNLPGVTADLNFTGAVLADIFLGKITKWNDPAIFNLNPTAGLPFSDIVVIHRSDSSNFWFTDYLSKVSPDLAKNVGRNSYVIWPVGTEAKGDAGAASAMNAQPGSITYLDLAFALKNHLPYGRVQNANKQFIKANLASVSLAAAKVPQVAADVQDSLTNAAGNGVYPISTFTWLLIPDTFRNTGKSEALKNFLLWALSEGEQQVEPFDFAQLPPRVAQSAINDLVSIH